MKTMFLAAAAVFSLGVGSAYADGGQGTLPNTFFTELPGVIAQPPVQKTPSAMATNQNGAVTHAYVASSNRGTWLFPPDQNAGSNS
jgi:hypothetical protein